MSTPDKFTSQEATKNIIITGLTLRFLATTHDQGDWQVGFLNYTADLLEPIAKQFIDEAPLDLTKIEPITLSPSQLELTGKVLISVADSAATPMIDAMHFALASGMAFKQSKHTRELN